MAFAEGYLAADPKKNPSRAMRALKITQYILSVLIFAAILFTFMGIKFLCEFLLCLLLILLS